MRLREGWRRALGISIATLLVIVASQVEAVPPAAEALFREGRRLMAQGNTAAACAQFAESYALEPASGTLLNLALCHEKEGKTATAWAEYRSAAALAREQDRNDRMEAAEARIAVLEAKLARVTFVAVKRVPDIKVSDDDAKSGPLALGTAVPLDPGVHYLRATAPGYRALQMRVEISDGEQRIVTIPKLQEEVIPPRSPAAPATASAPPIAMDTRVPDPRPSSGGRSLDFNLAAGGGALLLSGTAVWGIAYLDYESAKSACNQGSGCPDYAHRVSVINTLKGIAISAWAVGGAAVLASGLHYKLRKSPDNLQVAFDPTKLELDIRGRF